MMAGVDQRHGEQHAGQTAGVFLQSGRNARRIGEIAEFRRAAEGRRREGHHRDGADDDEHDSQPKIDPLIAR